MLMTVDCADYTVDYESSDATLADENDLERSLREILPSEGHRMKVQQESLLDTSPRAEADATDGDLHVGANEDSFTRFNIAMVQQYFREEAVHQQHKHTMLLLREQALKEKTAMELAWLQQLQQQHRQDKGSDDKHPDIIRKRKNIIRAHRRTKDELRRLQKASKLSLEAQQLMLKESNAINGLQKEMLRVREKLRKAGVEPAMISSVDSASDDDQNVTPRSDKDDDSSCSAGVDAEAASKGKASPKLKLDKKYLTAREQQLCERRHRLMEQRDTEQRLKEKEREIEQLELEKKTLQKLQDDKSRSTGL